MSAFLNPISVRFARNYNRLCNTTVSYSYARVYCLLKRLKSDENKSKTEKTEEEEDKEEYNDIPVKYTTSDAHQKWKAAYNFRIPEEENPYPSYQWPVIVTSISAILIYFACIREENDIDENLSKPLFERFPQLEKPMLEQSIRDHKLLNQDTTELEKRLKEIS